MVLATCTGIASVQYIRIHTYPYSNCTTYYRLRCRGVGCIFFEMVAGRPLFPAGSADEQLAMIFRTLGRPNETNWPGIDKNAPFRALNVPNYKRQKIQLLAPRYELFRYARPSYCLLVVELFWFPALFTVLTVSNLYSPQHSPPQYPQGLAYNHQSFREQLHRR